MQETFGIRDESVFKAASGFHGGIGAQRDVCGALIGASLMLGLIHGSTIEESGKPRDNPGQLDASTQTVGELYKWFENEFSSVKCQTIRGMYEKEVEAEPDAAELSKKEKAARIRSRCDRLAGKTAARTAEMLWDAID